MLSLTTMKMKLLTFHRHHHHFRLVIRSYITDVDDFIQHKITTHVEYGSNGPYTHPETGTYSRSFRIKYKINDPTGIQPEVTKRQAKELHKEVCRRIPIEFPGITLRQNIRS